VPGVTVLKPLCGADAELKRCLDSFFRLDYPNFELVFGVMDPDDPALGVVRELCARYPNVSCKVVVHDGSGALNPKVDNLSGMVPHASFDLLVVSDSNVRVPAHYVSELVSVMQSSQAGLVTNLFAGEGENTLGAALECVQLNGFCAAGLALPTLLGDSLVVGKSTLFSRSTFDQLGGFERLSDLLAEDFVLGKMYQHAGLRVVIAPTVLINVTRGLTLRGFMRRHIRWGMLRWRLRPLGALLEPVASPLCMLPFAYAAFGAWSLLWLSALLSVRDVGGWLAVRGTQRVWIAFVLSPLRDIATTLAWFISALKRHISWRGTRLRLGAGTLLFEERNSHPT
jgi:ceramide glucosyltransferase